MKKESNILYIICILRFSFPNMITTPWYNDVLERQVQFPCNFRNETFITCTSICYTIYTYYIMIE